MTLDLNNALSLSLDRMDIASYIQRLVVNMFLVRFAPMNAPFFTSPFSRFCDIYPNITFTKVCLQIQFLMNACTTVSVEVFEKKKGMF